MKKTIVLIRVSIVIIAVSVIGMVTHGYEYPTLSDHFVQLQVLTKVSPDFKQRVKSCTDVETRTNEDNWRPFYDDIEVKKKDANFGFGIMCDNGRFLMAFIIDSKRPTFYHYSIEETKALFEGS